MSSSHVPAEGEHAALRSRASVEESALPQTVDDQPAAVGRALRLQRLAGNAAVARLLRQQPPTSSSRVGRLDRAVVQRSPTVQEQATAVAAELQTLIQGATWKEIRKRVYPKESAAGIKRAKDRKAGKLPDLTGPGRSRRSSISRQRYATCRKSGPH